MSLPNGYSINSPPSESGEDEEPLIKNNPVVQLSSPVPPQCCSARLNLAILMFLGFSVVYGLRVNLSVAMVAMVNTTDPDATKNSSVIHACPLPSGAENGSQTFQQPAGIPQYPWDSETQGWLLGAFFFGYLCTQIPGGYLAGHYGGSIFLGLGVLGTAVLTLLTPLAAKWGSYWLFALRALEGFGEGVTFPAMMAMWARWAPPLERSRLTTLSGSGSSFGAFLALPLTGYICEQLGWPAVFYICGGAGCFWAILWFAFVSDDPRTHRRISDVERDYIINSIGPQGTGHGWSLPLLSMMLSVPLWAIILTQMSANWAFYTLLTSLPTYMSDILHFDLQSNGFLSALPYLGSLVVSLLSAVAADILIERKVFSVTIVRKIFTVTGLVLPAVFLVAVNYAGCDHILTVTFFTLSSSLGGTSAPGVYINQIDIAPRYAGFLLGITNTFGTIPGVLAPIVTGYFTEDHSLAGWRKVFWVAAGINLGGAIIYLLLGTADIQPWANPDEEGVRQQKRRGESIS
uniref:Sialin n=1 Tax=Oryzias latipes TaxID=8090 RepID=A0A3P9H1W5_ORYLA